jgi:hypothetical protein
MIATIGTILVWAIIILGGIAAAFFAVIGLMFS